MPAWLIALCLATVHAAAMAIDEPRYAVECRLEGADVEVRRDAPHAVAQVRVDGRPVRAGSEGFRIVAEYVFGKNQGEHLDRRRVALRAAHLEPTGEPTLARFNGPMTPWFMRRDAIWLPPDPQ